ncbi:hypothetical protein MKW94_030681 [Papaver nudicaule]|uniref:Ubiquitin-like domain-containing protein n=1 Tax=Papaver nudicaule TaxID=74823 RepID=A0AA42AVK7_PAPNU|nr:hypothetical protein [Papaver nudicaule]
MMTSRMNRKAKMIEKSLEILDVFFSLGSYTMNVIVVTRSGEFTMQIGFSESVFDIKRRIEQGLGIEVSTQILTVYGLELIDGLDMGDYPIIVEGTRIDLNIKNKEVVIEVDPNRIQIVLLISKRKAIVEVDRTETVASLKEKIHGIDGSPIKRTVLSFSGIEMNENYRSLCEYGICEGSEVSVFYRNVNHPIRGDQPSARRLSLVVQTTSVLNSARIPLEMFESNTIRDIRRVLLDGKMLPQDDYFFIHKQRIMQDDCSLRWHGVEDGDFLYVFKGTVSRDQY